MIAETHIWRTDDGRLVPDGHPDAAVLAYPRGHNVPEQVAVKAGLKPSDKAKAKGEDKSAPVTDGPTNPRRIWPSRGSQQADEQGDSEPELDEEALRAEAAELGIKVHPNAKAETVARRIAEARAEQTDEA